MRTRAWLGVGLLMVFVGLTVKECFTQSDRVQREQQERILMEGASQVGMPAIKNFRERKILKDILEMRDQNGLTTFTYLAALDNKLALLCESIGYGIPYATQFTQLTGPCYLVSALTLPQAEPNGLFSPASAEGTWIQCKDPHGKDVRPVYVEPRIIVSPFRLAP
jgi:hypothetical protein